MGHSLTNHLPRLGLESTSPKACEGSAGGDLWKAAQSQSSVKKEGMVNVCYVCIKESE